MKRSLVIADLDQKTIIREFGDGSLAAQSTCRITHHVTDLSDMVDESRRLLDTHADTVTY